MKISQSLRWALRILGVVCIGLGAYLAWQNMEEATAAEQSSQEIALALDSSVSQQIHASEDGEMPIEEVDGVAYIGNISIPSESIQLPVAATYDFEQMAKTPTRYRGSYYTDDLVICAHNYSRQFDPLRTIALGEKIILQTVDGQTYQYVITNREIIKPTAVEKVFKDQGQDDDWDLTLFTCTPAGAARVLVRCVRV